MDRFYDLLAAADSRFYVESNSKRSYKNQLLEKIAVAVRQLRAVYPDWTNKLVYLDIQDRELFIYLFFALSFMKSKIVLIPIEIKYGDQLQPQNIYLTDNKKQAGLLMINKDLSIDQSYPIACHLWQEQQTAGDFFLFTSGSTGQSRLIPKQLTHILIELEELSKNLVLDKAQLFFFTPPLYHIYGLLFGLLLPIYTGNPVIIDYLFTPDTISDFVEQKKITFFVSIPAYYKMFVDLDQMAKFKTCSHLLSSSAPLPVSISRCFYEKTMSIIEIYGSTETGGIAYRVSARALNWSLFSYIQIKPGSEYELEGVTHSELVIDSPAISVPYDSNTGYETGDIVSFGDNNSFSLAGRNTHFVKIGGKRIDLGYVLGRYRQYLKDNHQIEADKEAVYIGEKKGKIFLLSEIKFHKDPHLIKNDLKQYLPGYAIPRIFLHIQIPRNTMQKIDRRQIDQIIAPYF